MADLRTEIIDGIKLSNNGIGIINYKTLANLPNLNNYVKKDDILGTISGSNGPGIQITNDGKLTARGADIKGSFDGSVSGKFGGEVVATKLTLSNIKIPYTDISGTPVLHKVATSGSYNDLTGTPDLTPYMKKDGTVYGTISDTGTGVKIESNGKLTARNADIKGNFSGSANITSGTIGGCSITDGKLYIPYSQITNFATKTQFSGSFGSIDLESKSKTLEVATAIVNGDLRIGEEYGRFIVGSYNSTDLFDKNEDITTDSTFFVSINKNTLVRADFRCTDLSEQIKPKKGDAVLRVPICSAGDNTTRIGYCQSSTNNGTPRVRVYAQWGNSDFTQGFINIDSTSDIRLKENIKDSTIAALPLVMNMPVREFDWKKSKTHQPLGLVADEIEELDPLLTIGGGYDEDGTMNTKCIDRLLLTEYAIKAIQEQQVIIDKQQKEIEALKRAINIK